MSHEDLTPPRFSSAEPEELSEYRSLSWLALVALGLGVASGTVLQSARLCLIPILAVALALTALRRIARSQSRLIGRKAALGGLTLGLLFGVWGVTQDLVRQRLLCNQARPHALEWLELVQAGRLYEAYELHSSQDRRQPPGTDLQERYTRNRESRRSLEMFFQQRPLQKIKDLGRKGTLRFVADEGIVSEREFGLPLDHVCQRFAFDYEEQGQPQSLTFLVTLTRRYHRETDEVRWELRDVALPRRSGA